MPSVVNRVVSVAEQLATMRAQITQLQTFPPSGMTLLGQAFNTLGTSGGGYYGGPGFLYLRGGAAPQVAFTLIRPCPILVIAEIGGLFGSGGTANYTTVRAAIQANSTDTVGADDIHGVEMRGSTFYQTQGSGVANATSSLCYTPPAGTYWATWGYQMQGGAGTTFNLEWTGISVYQISG